MHKQISMYAWSLFIMAYKYESILSVSLLYFAYNFILGVFGLNSMSFTYIITSYILSTMSWEFVIIGFVIGAAGSILAVRKFLKV